MWVSSPVVSSLSRVGLHMDYETTSPRPVSQWHEERNYSRQFVSSILGSLEPAAL